MFRHDAQHASSTTIAGLPIAHPKILWSTNLPSAADVNNHSNAGPSLGMDGTIFAASCDVVYAVNPNGTIKWQTSDDGSGNCIGQPAISDDGKVFYSSYQAVVALSTSTGAPIWSVNPMANAPPFFARIDAGDLIIGPTGTIFGGVGDANLATYNEWAFAMSPTNGSVYWFANDGGTTGSAQPEVVGTPALSPDGTTTYFRASNTNGYGDIFAVKSGNALGVSTRSLASQYATDLAVEGDNTIYASKRNGPNSDQLIRLNLLSGTTLWTSATVTQDPPFSVTIGTAYVYGVDLGTSKLLAYDKTNGNLAWSVPGVPSAPPLLLGSSTLYYETGGPASNDSLTDLDANTGQQRWQILFDGVTMGGANGAGGIAVSTSGVVYILHKTATPGRTLYAIADSGAATVAVTSTTPSYSGSIFTSTVSVVYKDGSNNPTPGTILQLSNTGLGTGSSFNPISGTLMFNVAPYLQFSADNSGTVSFSVQMNLNSLPHAQWAGYVSTINLTLPGFAPWTGYLEDTRASTFTVTVSSPSIEDYGTGTFVRVSTLTFTVKDALNNPVASFPVGLDLGSYNYNAGGACGQIATYSPSSPFVLTDGSGHAQYTVRIRLTAGMTGNIYYCVDPAQFSNYVASVTAFALDLPPVGVDTRETRVSTFTITFSTPTIQSDIRSTTMTVTAYDASGSTVPAEFIALNNLLDSVAGGPFATYQFNNLGVYNQTQMYGYTDSYGKAVFPITIYPRGGSGNFDSWTDFVASAPVFGLDVAVSSPAFFVESNYLDHYTVTAPASIAVGVSFVSTVTAVNVHNHALGMYNESGVNLVPLFAGTNVQGTGTLGTSQITFSASPGKVVVSSQNYNRIEDIQIKAVRNTGAESGLSGNLNVTGPDHFNISIATGSPAGSIFVATITAVDASGNQVVGYTGTLALSPVVWNSTGTPASGQLSVTNVNMPGQGQVALSNESYNTGGGIRIRAYDSALNIVGYSSSMTVTLPPLTIDHYAIKVATSAGVGSNFPIEIDALDASSSPVTYSLNLALNLQAFLHGTAIAGTGSLGNSAPTLVAGTTYVVIPNETYNRIENVDLQASDTNARYGTSLASAPAGVAVTGPTHYVVNIATWAQAGQPFSMSIVAKDAGGSTVTGYSGTVQIAAVQAATPTLSGGGVLGVTSLNVSGGAASTSFQQYTKAESIEFRVTDSGIGVTSYSSSMTVQAGPPNSLVLTANPQSTVAGIATVLTATAQDLYLNPVSQSTVTFALANGSGTVAAYIGSLPSAVTSTSAVTNALGQAQAFFASTNTTSSQADLITAQIGGLNSATTIYNYVLIGQAGGTIVSMANPNYTAVIPPNAYAYNVRMGVASRTEMAASDIAIATAAMASSPNTFVSTQIARCDVLLNSNPSQTAPPASQLVTVQLPMNVDASSNVTVGSYRTSSIRPQSLLVPASVLRVFKLNKATSIFEMVLDGTNLPDINNKVVRAQVADPSGIFTLGAPPYTTVQAGSSATITSPLGSGATATVLVPAGAFPALTSVQLAIPSGSSVPPLPNTPGVAPTGVTISVSAGGMEPVEPVTVQIGYTDAQMANFNTDTLRMARYDANTGWVILDSQVDTVGRVVTGQTNSFSLFQVVAITPSSDLSTGYAYPNPFRPSVGHTAMNFASLPANADIKIYSLSGRLLQELTADSSGRVFNWNVQDREGRSLPSGVYFAVFKSGSSTRTFKFAVQR